jgi:recombination protein RecT
MSAVQTKTREVTPQEQLRTQLASMGPELRNALPSHIKPEKFQRVVMTVAQQQPDLLAADRRSLLGACMKCAADGLIPDGREAALVIFNVNAAPKGQPARWEKRVQYMPMLAGIQKRVRNSGEVAGIEAHVIYENDEFIWKQGLEGTIIHTPKFPGPRGEAIGAYAIARFKDGSLPQYEVMDLDEIRKVQAVSRSRDRDGNPTGPWKEWWSEMARKTVFRRLSKWLPMDAEADALLSRDDENERTIEGRAEAPLNVTPLAPVSKLDALESSIVSDEETGEVLTGEVVSDTDPQPSAAAALITQVEAAPTVETLNSLIVSKAFADARKTLSADAAKALDTAIKARKHGLSGSLV